MSGNILIVEDEHNLRQALINTHKREGYTVTEAPNGQSALQLLEEAPTPHGYDVVLTDIMMGEVGGLEVTIAARNMPDPPEVILLTGYGSLETAIMAIRAGAFDYQEKPCPMDILLERVSTAMRKRHHHHKTQARARALNFILGMIEHYQCNGPTDMLSDMFNQPDKPEEHRYIRVGGIVIDTHQHKVWFHGEVVSLTPSEYDIIVCLARTPGQVRTYSEILLETNGQKRDSADAHNIVRQHMGNLRKKFSPAYFENAYRVGYKIKEPNQPKPDTNQ